MSGKKTEQDAAVASTPKEIVLPESMQRLLGDSDLFYKRILLQSIVNLTQTLTSGTEMAERVCAIAEKMYQPALREKGFPVYFYGSEEDKAYGIEKDETAEPEEDNPAEAEVEAAPEATEETQKNSQLTDADRKAGFYTGQYVVSGVFEKDWEIVKAFFQERLNELDVVGPPQDFINLQATLGHFGLNKTQKLAASIAYAAPMSPTYGLFVKSILTSGSKNYVAPALACMVADMEGADEIDAALGQKGLLTKNGLFSLAEQGFSLPDLTATLVDNVQDSKFNEADILGALIGKPTTTEYDLEDYAYLGNKLTELVEFVKNAVAKGEKGVNILFYGPPGEGKSELKRVIAKALGYDLYEIGEDRDGDRTISSAERRIYKATQAWDYLKDRRDAIVGLEEAEDLVPDERAEGKAAFLQSKSDVNSLLEDNPVVQIVTCNDQDRFHRSFRQRFSFSLFIECPPTLARVKIWERHLAKQGVELSKEDVLELARNYEAPPRMIANASRYAALSGGNINTIKNALENGALLTYDWSEALTVQNRVPQDYNRDLINAGPEGQAAIDELIAEGCERPGEERVPFSLLVKTVPGSGAPSTLRYMAEQMTMNVHEISCKTLMKRSDVSSEARIAAAFKVAANSESFLILRDLDALAGSTAPTHRDWNDSPAVEAFQKAARIHNLPFAVTCALNVDVPETVSQTFSDRLELKVLEGDTLKAAYKQFFKRDAPASISELKDYTPNDFVAVKSLLARSKAAQGDDRILELLRKQKGARMAPSSRVVRGFAPDVPSAA